MPSHFMARCPQEVLNSACLARHTVSHQPLEEREQTQESPGDPA